MKIDIELKQVLSQFKLAERESLNDALKRVVLMALGKKECEISEAEKKAILNSINSINKGKAKSFNQMLKSVQKKRTSRGKEFTKGKTRGGDIKDVLGD